jgi:hypothetical protein
MNKTTNIHPISGHKILQITGSAGNDKRFLKKFFKGKPAKGIHLDLCIFNGYDPNYLRHIFHLISETDCCNIESLCLEGLRLILPGNDQNNLSFLVVDRLIDTHFPNLKEKFLLLPISPNYISYIQSHTHFFQNLPYSIADFAKYLGYFVIGLIEEQQRFFELFESSLPEEFILGKTKETLFMDYISLFDHLDAIKDIAGVLLYENKRLGRSKVGAPLPQEKNALTRQSIKTTLSEEKIVELMTAVRQQELFNTLEIIELLLVVTGEKRSMRTSVRKKFYKILEKLFIKFGLCIHLDYISKKMRIDKGKGGWSNLYDPSIEKVSSSSEMLIYISMSQTLAQSAAEAEKNDDESFGEILDYPACCRNAFLKNLPIAAKKQGDLVPLVANNTVDSWPWPYLLNTASRYFMAHVLSYYPCSYTCSNALTQAKRYFTKIQQFLPDIALNIQSIMSAPILYTEYRGIYAFVNARIETDKIIYDSSSVLSTTDNSLGKLIKSSNMLFIRNYDHVEILAEGMIRKTLRGENVRLLVFGGEYTPA